MQPHLYGWDRVNLGVSAFVMVALVVTSLYRIYFKNSKMKESGETNYTRFLAPADVSGVVFTCGHFQKVAQISSLCNFYHIIEGIPSLMHFWLLMN